MRIGVDIDGVIIDFVGAFIRVLRGTYGITLAYNEILCHDLSQVLGLPKEEVAEMIDRTMEENAFDLIPGSREALIRLARAGHEIVLITSRPRRYLHKTREVLAKHQIPYKKLVFTRFLAKHSGGKGLDIAIEDSLEEAISLAQRKIRVLLISHPWNRSTLNARGSLTTVCHWDDALATLEEMGVALGSL